MSKNESVENAKTAEEKTAREVLFFELEVLATSGRAAMAEAIKKVMKSKDMDVTPALFSRCCITPRPGAAINALIEDSGRNLTTGDQLTDQAETALKKFFADEAELNKELPALIKAAQARDIQVVAVSPWAESVSAPLMERLGLTELGVDLEAIDCEDDAFPRADHWLRILKQRGQDKIPLIAVVTSHMACRGAMTAGATCIAIPDEYTAFESFSGAKVVLDSISEMPADELLDLVSRR
jgi:beta-phosphoglucomutase-like phosphatase (HAD superfamily)